MAWSWTGSKGPDLAAAWPRRTSNGRSTRVLQLEDKAQSRASGEPPHDAIPLMGIPRVTAERLSAYWIGAPQVTEGIHIDTTKVRSLRTASRAKWRAAFSLGSCPLTDVMTLLQDRLANVEI